MAYLSITFVVLVLALAGICLGHRGRVIVHNGRTDLVLSFLLPALVLAALGDFPCPEWVRGLLQGLSVLGVAWSLGKSWAANPGVGKMLVVFPAKFVLAGLVTLCAIVAVGGALAGLNALNRKKPREAAANLAVGAVGAIGYWQLRKLLLKLEKTAA